MFLKYKLYKETKKDLKASKKERKRCQKTYPDWEDNEYNCGPLKFIWGVKSKDDLSNSKGATSYTLNDLDIMYNRDTKKYILDLETIYNFNTIAERTFYLEELLEKFNLYLFSSSFYDNKFNPFYLHLYGTGELFIADSITELYYKFKIFVKGYQQL